MKDTRDSGGKVARHLVALSSAAVLTVYTAGYVRTRSAADRVARQEAARTAAVARAVAATPVADPLRVEAPPAPVAPPAADAATRAQPRRAPAPARTADAGAPATPAAAEPVIPIAPTETPPSEPQPQPAALPDPEPTPPPVQASAYRDGTYLGWGSCRHGTIQAQVVIDQGRIASATIAQCLTRYSCSWISSLPSQVVTRQNPQVDYVSGATESTDAFYYAVVEALSKAK